MKMFHTLGTAWHGMAGRWGPFRQVKPPASMAWHGIGLFGETSTAQMLFAKKKKDWRVSLTRHAHKTLEWCSRCAPRPSFAKGQMPNWSVKTNNAP
jgi:hypothetical protein